MHFILLFLYFVTQVNVGLSQEARCSSNECVRISNCPELLKIYSQSQQSRENTKLLREAHCGYDTDLITPKVCCGNSEASPPTLAPSSASGASCATPDGQIGQCVDLYNCPHITQMLSAKPVTPDTKSFVQNSRCNGKAQYSVCCGPTPLAQQIGRPKGKQCVASAAPPDSRTQCCGLEVRGGNRITGGNETAIDQYPWLVLIEYRNKYGINTYCGGALISSRYVLTAAHCVVGEILQYGAPVNVRLGEYDTNNDGKDCVNVEGGGVDCTDPIVIIPIEKIITHPQYSSSRKDDIALIRLKDAAPYTNFIRPICLPTQDWTTSPPDEFDLFVAGWGKVNENITSSNIKLHVQVPHVKLEDCQSNYDRTVKERLVLTEKQMCAGGEEGKDSCRGDSGGPLMHENDRLFEVIGVVSFGYRICGTKAVPGVYTKVYQYNSWIRSQIRP